MNTSRHLMCLATLILAACGDELLCPEPALILIESPGSTITTDGDPVAPGVQIDVRARTTLAAGAGVTLVVTDEAAAQVATGSTTVDASGNAVFPGVTLPFGVVTVAVSSVPGDCEASHDELTVDVQGGVFDGVTIAVVQPATACGAQITPAADQDPSTAGVQVLARVTAPGATSPRVQVQNADGTSTLAAPTDTIVTLTPGANELRGIATDPMTGGDVPSDACPVTVADLAVSFAAPAADGAVGVNDGTVAGEDLTMNLCGTVNTTGAMVSVTVDGGSPLPATVTGTGWCRTITIAESPPIHTIVATATKSPSFGSATLILQADLTAPDDIVDFAAIDVDRQRIRMTWTAPGDGGNTVDSYVIKYSTTTITDANFDAVGTALPFGPPHTPGTPETIDLFPARTGTPYWVAVAAQDTTGNRGTAAIAGPLTPVFDQTGAIEPGDPSAGNLNAGWSIAAGRFNDDDFADVAVGAPGETVGANAAAGAVYVYFGGALGIATTPDLIIQGGPINGRLGTGATSVAWTTANREDLVISAPGEAFGVVYVFHGGAGFPTGTVSASAADTTIAAANNAGWFASASLGTALARGFIDDDAVPDLVISAPTGGGARGGIVMIFGGTASAASIGLSDVDSGAANGAVATLIEDPAAATGRKFGTYVHVVGPTLGALDATDDVVVGYTDDATVGDWMYLFRPDGTRPASPGVTQSGFLSGRDVRIDLTSTAGFTELGAQATTIEDQNGDGARDLVIATIGNNGQALILDGAAMGINGAVATSAITLTTINAATGTLRFGAAIAEHDTGMQPDIDGDGHEDLMIAGVTGGVGRFHVWYGGSIPTGTVTVQSAQYAITAPSEFLFVAPSSGRGPRGQARWVGDVDGDGLDDVCWAAPNDNSRDGGFEVLFD